MRALPDRLTSLAKSAIRRYPGKLPAYNLRLKALRAHRIPALKRFETQEAERAVRQWGRRPVASVATIIPTYKRPEQVVEAINSALAQTWEDQVVIVIDDGAGLPPLPDDDRVFAYSLSRNCGIAGIVRNVGIRASASRWVAFLDDDNTWTPDHLTYAMGAHAAGAELTYSAIERVRPDGTRKDVLSHPFDREVMKERGICDTNTIVAKRTPDTRFSRVPRRHGDFPLEDWELVFRLSESLRTEHLPKVTATYLVHDGSFFSDWDRAEAREAASLADAGPDLAAS
ncbi:MAG: glycosyltransferase family A protein [Actinomycetota bacterium]|nr:glycosyltransferase family A protein [Actinomycetota bacterium]